MQIRTTRLLLRELREADAPYANEHENAPALVRFSGHAPRTVDDTLGRIREAMADAERVPRRVFDLAIEVGERCIGRVGFRVDEQGRSAMLWWVVNPMHHGKGIATEGALAMMHYAFADLGLHRVWADIDPRNTPSIRVAEKLGLRHEGHLREATFAEGEWVDSALYALLDREWRARCGTAQSGRLPTEAP